MKVVLIIIAIIAALTMLVYIPWIVGGAIAVIICFWMDWYVAGVISGLIAIFMQVAVGSAIWDGLTDYSEEDSSEGGGFGFPEMFAAYKFGEKNGRKDDD